MPFNELSKVLDLANLQCTQYKHNNDVFLPQLENLDLESAHQTRRLELNRMFSRVVANHTANLKSKPNSLEKQVQNESNLSPAELDGLLSSRRKIEAGQLLVVETDKSKRFAIMRPEQYIESGFVHTSKDFEISPEQIKRVQNSVNDHCWWIIKITNVESNWQHEDRMSRNLNDKGEQSCNMTLLIKYHKAWSEDSGIRIMICQRRS